MFYLESRGIAASVFLVLFILELPLCLYNIKRQGLHFIHNSLFCVARIGACITGILVAEENFDVAADINVSVITADIVLTSIGTFWLYATAVSLYYLTSNRLEFDQTPMADKLHRFQNVMFTAMIALIIAAAAISNGATNGTTQQLREAYSILYIVATIIVSLQYIRLWLSRSPTNHTLFIWASAALVLIFIKAIYIVASAFVPSISAYNYAIVIGWYVGANLLLDFLASMLFTVGGLISPPKSQYSARASAVFRRNSKF